MRHCKRTIFNIIFQPKRIGLPLRYKGVRLIKKTTIKRTTMQKERRSHVGSGNKRINRFAIISRIILLRTFTRVKRGGSSVFVKRARYYATT
jgi:hypothetical protein